MKTVEQIAAARGIDIKREISKLRRRLRYKSEPTTVFPDLIDLLPVNGRVTVNDDGEISSPTLTARYVTQFNNLNHLKGAE